MNEMLGKKFHLEFGEPLPLIHGAPDDWDWGHWQFPSISRTTEGNIIANWAYGRDSSVYEPPVEGVVRGKVSEDNGKTWRLSKPTDEAWQFRMDNGKLFAGFASDPNNPGAHEASYINKYEPIWRTSNVTENCLYSCYLMDDIEEDTDDKRAWAIEIDPETGEKSLFECKVNWPNSPLEMKKYGDRYLVLPPSHYFALCNISGVISLDGAMFRVIYSPGFNSEAKTREELDNGYIGYSNVYIFRSDDCARTWNFCSQLLVNEDTFSEAEYYEGYSEPIMKVMPDGSVIMLIRTGCNNPMLFTRSTDNCKTWSKLVQFDNCGVLPRIMTLPCGVTVTSYGRPVPKVCATSDPSGLKWEDPIQLDLYGMKMEGMFQRSCFYTDMIAISDDTAMLIYSDFHYPNEDGLDTKTICVRTIKVVAD